MDNKRTELKAEAYDTFAQIQSIETQAREAIAPYQERLTQINKELIALQKDDDKGAKSTK